jgi:hypothetical protein
MVVRALFVVKAHKASRDQLFKILFCVCGTRPARRFSWELPLPAKSEGPATLICSGKAVILRQTEFKSVANREGIRDDAAQ